MYRHGLLHNNDLQANDYKIQTYWLQVEGLPVGGRSPQLHNTGHHGLVP